MDSLFEFLFNYRPVVFSRGHLVWLGGPLAWGVAAIVLLGSVVALRTYFRVGGRSSARDRTILVALRAALVVLVLVLLFRPTLVVPAAVPQRNVIGVLLDDSRSMQIADGDSASSRGAFARATFGAAGSPLLDALAERFLVRIFRFDRHAGRITSAEDLTQDGDGSHLGAVLEDARRELTTAPLAGLILVTDGADNADSSLTPTLLGLKTRGVPVYTIGVGQDRFDRDIEVTRVDAPRTVLAGSSIFVEADLRHTGLGGRTVPVVVEGDGGILGSVDLLLPADGRAVTARVRVTPTAPGPLSLTVRVPEQAGEVVSRNNRRDLLVSVVQRREKILYFEGEPRYEFGFLRRAVAGDSALQVVGLLRSAEHKYLRLGVDDSLELLSGFPTRREDLFAYRALILGSVEASFFTADQLRMIDDFVSVRGGGLLALGGRRAYGEGGFAGTPVEDVYPVSLAGSSPGADVPVIALGARATPAGLLNPVAQLAGTADSSAQRWLNLPVLTSVNRVGGPKPGATVLLQGTNDGGDAQVLLAHQRFGRGKAVGLPVQDTWIWQMHADIPVEDQTHETFWRQLLRWLAESSPARVTATVTRDQVSVGEAIVIEAEVRDAAYNAVNGTAPVAHVTTPTGRLLDLPMEWAVDRDGVYRARVTATEEGRYAIDVRTEAGSEDSVRAEPVHVRAGDQGREFFGAERQEPLLRRIASETGGRYYTPATAAGLAEDIVYTEAGVTVLEEKDLWNMPIVFLLLLGLVGAEWAFRRNRGLA